MSEVNASRPTTIFEGVWQQPSGHFLFRSERHRVMAVADTRPRMPLQVVVAPADGTPGKKAHFYDLKLSQQRRLLEVGLAVGSKILNHCNPGQRSMCTLEGFGVEDHPHIVYYAGERGQGKDRYNEDLHLGDAAVQQTLELIRFTAAEATLLEARLDLIS